jgi:hypothetical protein
MKGFKAGTWVMGVAAAVCAQMAGLVALRVVGPAAGVCLCVCMCYSISVLVFLCMGAAIDSRFACTESFEARF